MNQDDSYTVCLRGALHYLDAGPRTEREIVDYLAKKQRFSNEIIARVISELKKNNLINDRIFADLWSNSRNEFRPKSRSMVRYEMLKKGIDPDIAEEAISQIDDADNALKLGMKKAASIKSSDYREFYRKLSGFLGRRGFDQEIVAVTVKIIWKNINSQANKIE